MISFGYFQVQKSLSTDETKLSDSAHEQTSTLTSHLNVTTEKDRDALLDENDGTSSGKSVVQTDNEQQENLDNGSPMSDIPIAETLADDLGKGKGNTNHVEVPVTDTDAVAVASTSNGELLDGRPSDVHEEQSPAKGVEIANETHPLDDSQSNKSGGADVPPKIDQEISDSINTDTLSNTETQTKVADIKLESIINQKKQHEHKAGKVQEQLDEVKYLPMVSHVLSIHASFRSP